MGRREFKITSRPAGLCQDAGGVPRTDQRQQRIDERDSRCAGREMLLRELMG